MGTSGNNTGLYVLGGGALLLALAGGGAHTYRKRRRSSVAPKPPSAPTSPSRAAGILARFKRGEKMREENLLDVAGEGARTGECAAARKAVAQLARAEASFKKVWVNEIGAVRDEVRAACGRAAPQRRKRKARRTARRRRRS